MRHPAKATGEDLTLVERLYFDVGYGAALAPDDTVLFIRQGQSAVAAVRLSPEDGAVVLRGMHVHPAYQRQGLGTRLLRSCVPFLQGRPAYCLPYRHLATFYAAVGLMPVDSSSLPPALHARLSSYLSAGRDVIAMARSAGVCPTQHVAGQPSVAQAFVRAHSRLNPNVGRE